MLSNIQDFVSPEKDESSSGGFDYQIDPDDYLEDINKFQNQVKKEISVIQNTVVSIEEIEIDTSDPIQLFQEVTNNNLSQQVPLPGADDDDDRKEIASIRENITYSIRPYKARYRNVIQTLLKKEYRKKQRIKNFHLKMKMITFKLVYYLGKFYVSTVFQAHIGPYLLSYLSQIDFFETRMDVFMYGLEASGVLPVQITGLIKNAFARVKMDFVSTLSTANDGMSTESLSKLKDFARGLTPVLDPALTPEIRQRIQKKFTEYLTIPHLSSDSETSLEFILKNMVGSTQFASIPEKPTSEDEDQKKKYDTNIKDLFERAVKYWVNPPVGSDGYYQEYLKDKLRFIPLMAQFVPGTDQQKTEGEEVPNSIPFMRKILESISISGTDSKPQVPYWETGQEKLQKVFDAHPEIRDEKKGLIQLIQGLIHANNYYSTFTGFIQSNARSAGEITELTMDIASLFDVEHRPSPVDTVSLIKKDVRRNLSRAIHSPQLVEILNKWFNQKINFMDGQGGELGVIQGLIQWSISSIKNRGIFGYLGTQIIGTVSDQILFVAPKKETRNKIDVKKEKEKRFHEMVDARVELYQKGLSSQKVQDEISTRFHLDVEQFQSQLFKKIYNWSQGKGTLPGFHKIIQAFCAMEGVSLMTSVFLEPSFLGTTQHTEHFKKSLFASIQSIIAGTVENRNWLRYGSVIWMLPFRSFFSSLRTGFQYMKEDIYHQIFPVDNILGIPKTTIIQHFQGYLNTIISEVIAIIQDITHFIRQFCRDLPNKHKIFRTMYQYRVIKFMLETALPTFLELFTTFWVQAEASQQFIQFSNQIYYFNINTFISKMNYGSFIECIHHLNSMTPSLIKYTLQNKTDPVRAFLQAFGIQTNDYLRQQGQTFSTKYTGFSSVFGSTFYPSIKKSDDEKATLQGDVSALNWKDLHRYFGLPETFPIKSNLDKALLNIHYVLQVSTDYLAWGLSLGSWKNYEEKRGTFYQNMKLSETRGKIVGVDFESKQAVYLEEEGDIDFGYLYPMINNVLKDFLLQGKKTCQGSQATPELCSHIKDDYMLLNTISSQGQNTGKKKYRDLHVFSDSNLKTQFLRFLKQTIEIEGRELSTQIIQLLNMTDSDRKSFSEQDAFLDKEIEPRFNETSQAFMDSQFKMMYGDEITKAKEIVIPDSFIIGKQNEDSFDCDLTKTDSPTETSSRRRTGIYVNQFIQNMLVFNNSQLGSTDKKIIIHLGKCSPEMIKSFLLEYAVDKTILNNAFDESRIEFSREVPEEKDHRLIFKDKTLLGKDESSIKAQRLQSFAPLDIALFVYPEAKTVDLEDNYPFLTSVLIDFIDSAGNPATREFVVPVSLEKTTPENQYDLHFQTANFQGDGQPSDGPDDPQNDQSVSGLYRSIIQIFQEAGENRQPLHYQSKLQAESVIRNLEVNRKHYQTMKHYTNKSFGKTLVREWVGPYSTIDTEMFINEKRASLSQPPKTISGSVPPGLQEHLRDHITSFWNNMHRFEDQGTSMTREEIPPTPEKSQINAFTMLPIYFHPHTVDKICESNGTSDASDDIKKGLDALSTRIHGKKYCQLSTSNSDFQVAQIGYQQNLSRFMIREFTDHIIRQKNPEETKVEYQWTDSKTKFLCSIFRNQKKLWKTQFRGKYKEFETTQLPSCSKDKIPHMLYAGDDIALIKKNQYVMEAIFSTTSKPFTLGSYEKTFLDNFAIGQFEYTSKNWSDGGYKNMLKNLGIFTADNDYIGLVHKKISCLYYSFYQPSKTQALHYFCGYSSDETEKRQSLFHLKPDDDLKSYDGHQVEKWLESIGMYLEEADIPDEDGVNLSLLREKIHHLKTELGLSSETQPLNDTPAVRKSLQEFEEIMKRILSYDLRKTRDKKKTSEFYTYYHLQNELGSLMDRHYKNGREELLEIREKLLGSTYYDQHFSTPTFTSPRKKPSENKTSPKTTSTKPSGTVKTSSGSLSYQEKPSGPTEQQSEGISQSSPQETLDMAKNDLLEDLAEDLAEQLQTTEDVSEEIKEDVSEQIKEMFSSIGDFLQKNMSFKLGSGTGPPQLSTTQGPTMEEEDPSQKLKSEYQRCMEYQPYWQVSGDSQGNKINFLKKDGIQLTEKEQMFIKKRCFVDSTKTTIDSLSLVGLSSPEAISFFTNYKNLTTFITSLAALSTNLSLIQVVLFSLALAAATTGAGLALVIKLASAFLAIQKLVYEAGLDSTKLSSLVGRLTTQLFQDGSPLTGGKIHSMVGQINVHRQSQSLFNEIFRESVVCREAFQNKKSQDVIIFNGIHYPREDIDIKTEDGNSIYYHNVGDKQVQIEGLTEESRVFTFTQEQEDTLDYTLEDIIDGDGFKEKYSKTGMDAQQVVQELNRRRVLLTHLYTLVGTTDFKNLASGPRSPMAFLGETFGATKEMNLVGTEQNRGPVGRILFHLWGVNNYRELERKSAPVENVSHPDFGERKRIRNFRFYGDRGEHALKLAKLSSGSRSEVLKFIQKLSSGSMEDILGYYELIKTTIRLPGTEIIYGKHSMQELLIEKIRADLKTEKKESSFIFEGTESSEGTDSFHQNFDEKAKIYQLLNHKILREIYNLFYFKPVRTVYQMLENLISLYCGNQSNSGADSEQTGAGGWFSSAKKALEQGWKKTKEKVKDLTNTAKDIINTAKNAADAVFNTAKFLYNNGLCAALLPIRIAFRAAEKNYDKLKNYYDSDKSKEFDPELLRFICNEIYPHVVDPSQVEPDPYQLSTPAAILCGGKKINFKKTNPTSLSEDLGGMYLQHVSQVSEGLEEKDAFDFKKKTLDSLLSIDPNIASQNGVTYTEKSGVPRLEAIDSCLSKAIYYFEWTEDHVKELVSESKKMLGAFPSSKQKLGEELENNVKQIEENKKGLGDLCDGGILNTLKEKIGLTVETDSICGLYNEIKDKKTIAEVCNYYHTEEPTRVLPTLCRFLLAEPSSQEFDSTTRDYNRNTLEEMLKTENTDTRQAKFRIMGEKNDEDYLMSYQPLSTDRYFVYRLLPHEIQDYVLIDTQFNKKVNHVIAGKLKPEAQKDSQKIIFDILSHPDFSFNKDMSQPDEILSTRFSDSVLFQSLDTVFKDENSKLECLYTLLFFKDHAAKEKLTEILDSTRIDPEKQLTGIPEFLQLKENLDRCRNNLRDIWSTIQPEILQQIIPKKFDVPVATLKHFITDDIWFSVKSSLEYSNVKPSLLPQKIIVAKEPDNLILRPSIILPKDTADSHPSLRDFVKKRGRQISKDIDSGLQFHQRFVEEREGLSDVSTFTLDKVYQDSIQEQLNQNHLVLPPMIDMTSYPSDTIPDFTEEENRILSEHYHTIQICLDSSADPCPPFQRYQIHTSVWNHPVFQRRFNKRNEKYYPIPSPLENETILSLMREYLFPYTWKSPTKIKIKNIDTPISTSTSDSARDLEEGNPMMASSCPQGDCGPPEFDGETSYYDLDEDSEDFFDAEDS